MTKWKCDAPAAEHTVYKSMPRLSIDDKCTMDPNSLRSKRTMNNIRSKRDTTVFLHTSYLYKSACKTTTCNDIPPTIQPKFRKLLPSHPGKTPPLPVPSATLLDSRDPQRSPRSVAHPTAGCDHRAPGSLPERLAVSRLLNKWPWSNLNRAILTWFDMSWLLTIVPFTVRYCRFPHGKMGNNLIYFQRILNHYSVLEQNQTCCSGYKALAFRNA